MECDVLLDRTRAERCHFVQMLGKADELLAQAEDMVLASRSHSPFNPYLTRLSDAQAKQVCDAIAEIRTVMLCAVRDLGNEFAPEPHINLPWALRSTFDNVAQVLEQLPPALGREVTLPTVGPNGLDRIDAAGRMKQLVRKLCDDLAKASD